MAGRNPPCSRGRGSQQSRKSTEPKVHPAKRLDKETRTPVIKGLYEAHLPVRDLQRSIEFYKKLGLEIAYEYDDVAFLWIVPKKVWLGLWQSEIPENRNPASFPGNGRHLAFEVDFEEIKRASEWLLKKGVTLRSHGGLEPLEPIVRPHQQNVSIYFDDPDGNALELICNLPYGSPTEPGEMMYLSQFEKLIHGHK